MERGRLRSLPQQCREHQRVHRSVQLKLQELHSLPGNAESFIVLCYQSHRLKSFTHSSKLVAVFFFMNDVICSLFLLS
ncbi:unnamed protein product [Amoebophrya sp. A25]|nr:unnamed protein product [Amoebophrya sp. A25]|eukprot:GSA25T00018770001.1